MGANKPLIKLFLACRASNDITYISETLRAINSPLFLRKKKEQVAIAMIVIIVSITIYLLVSDECS